MLLLFIYHFVSAIIHDFIIGYFLLFYHKLLLFNLNYFTLNVFIDYCSLFLIILSYLSSVIIGYSIVKYFKLLR